MRFLLIAAVVIVLHARWEEVEPRLIEWHGVLADVFRSIAGGGNMPHSRKNRAEARQAEMPPRQPSLTSDKGKHRAGEETIEDILEDINRTLARHQGGN